MIRLISAFVFGVALSVASMASAATPPANANVLVLQLKDGIVKIALDTKDAPKAAERLKQLTVDGFYNGVVFHRVIDGFMAQTGDPTGTGMGGSNYPDLPAEFSSQKFVRGTVGMARAQDPNSANSQFYIMFADGPFLDGKYTVVGHVISGMDVVDKIKKGDEANNGMVTDPDKIIKATLATK
ncbi:peptidylprolyl isomerase [Segnochrobactrum spirostomi]|uniref:Peptidyl-prolyl cis-trans isomerase n=1 Tax=Segnochrobactrum spirostomi TaxID=2608987 RepID=A0A6A7Y1D9_9HYPH|nr:peptidylprolyl isomerase [Segnochrobactrum spirostomi]MQT11642.1 peptidylprolyl isomerase [Segnochrobactrum spirostomi]